jgi:integrase
LLLTGARRGEIASLQWQNVDFKQKCLRLPDSKTGAKVIYLNEPALDIIQSLPRLSNNLYVIPGNRVGAASGAINRAWSRVRLAAGLRDVRLHDLRHSFASIGIVDGLSLSVIGALLGHKHAATTARYAHLAPGPVRTANDAIGLRIAAAMALAVPAAEPTSLPKRTKTR